MRPRYHNSSRDDWSYPRQRRHSDFGHGKIVSALEDDNVWRCIHTGLGWMVATVWGVTAMIFVVAVL